MDFIVLILTIFQGYLIIYFILYCPWQTKTKDIKLSDQFETRSETVLNSTQSLGSYLCLVFGKGSSPEQKAEYGSRPADREQCSETKMKYAELRRPSRWHGALNLSQTNMADDSDNSPTTNTHKQHRRAKMCGLISFFIILVQNQWEIWTYTTLKWRGERQRLKERGWRTHIEREKRERMKESESQLAESQVCSSRSPHRKRINTVWGGGLN